MQIGNLQGRYRSWIAVITCLPASRGCMSSTGTTCIS